MRLLLTSIVAVVIATTPAQADLLETIVVPLDGSVVESVLSYEAGAEYLVRASGTGFVCVQCGELADAQYTFYPGDVTVRNIVCNGTVDAGIAIDELTISAERHPYWGPYDPSHEYEILLQGRGGTLRLQYHDCKYEDNAGTLTVRIFSTAVPNAPSTWGTLKQRF